jgi:tRNA threonylcarbamoyladenosine biosynthesis protein TsaB
LIVLGIETATQICGVALFKDGTLLAEYRMNIKNAHAKLLAGAIDKVCHDSKVALPDLSGIAVSIGPGSFTGLRIGLSIAKGIAFAHGLAITAVSTLKAIASQAPLKDGLVCPMVRSRANEVYTALYERFDYDDKLVEEVTVMPLENMLQFAPKGTAFIGDTAGVIQTFSREQDYHIIPKEFSLPSGHSIAKIGSEQISIGRTDDLATLEPFYLQEFITGLPKKTLEILGEKNDS